VENQNPTSTSTSSHKVSWWEAFLVIILTFFLTGIIGGIILFTAGTGSALVVGELVILLVPLVYLLSKRIDVKKYIRLNLKPKYILIGIGCAFLLLLLNIVSSALLTYIFGTSQAVEASNASIIALSATPLGLIAVTLSLLLAGICEEFALRGFLQNSLNRIFIRREISPTYSFLIATLISAAVFGLFHFDPEFVYILAAFFSGLALGAIYHRWGYVTAATSHSVMNLIVLFMLMFGI
jgi:membrane protease YdiL (CAAX protease family)